MTDAVTLDIPAVGAWQVATVVDIRPETPSVKTFRLALTGPSRHLAGQHYLVRLTAPDGYTAQRSYSVATPPDGTAEIELAVERLPDGEVSTFLHDELVVGDTLDVRGPIGGWFVWNGEPPALLVGGGSGIVPLMAMLRLGRRDPGRSRAHLVVSVRTPTEAIFAPELTGPDVTVVYSRAAAPGATRPAGRLTVGDLAPVLDGRATVFVCGSTRFAEAASGLLLAAGVAPESVRVERFGPTG